MSLNVLNSYSILGGAPIAQVTPFTYREAATLMSIMESFKDWAVAFGPEVQTILNDAFEEFDKTYTGTILEWETRYNEFMANVQAKIGEFAEIEAKNAVDTYLADPSTIDNAVTAKINQTTAEIRQALDALYASKPAFNNLSNTVGSQGTAINNVEALANETDATVKTGRLSTDALESTIQGTPVNPHTFLPIITLQNKLATSGYRYEVVIAHADGTPRPGIVGKMYANDFHTNAPKGDMFVVPGGVGETMVSMASRSGADIVSSSVGWQTATDVPNTWAMRGPQIKDGVVYRDFEPNSNRGRHALGVHDDGRILPYRIEDGWTADEMVAAGVVQAFGFGPLLVFNGAQQNVEAISWSSSLTDGRISARTILGVRANHDVVLIEVVGSSADGEGVGGNNMAALAFAEGCINAVLLDGGGSTQAVANGVTFHPSSDSDQVRDLGEGLLLYGRLTSIPDSSAGIGPTPLKLAAGFMDQSADYKAGAINRGGQVSLVGGVSPTSGLFPANEWVVIGNVPDIARPKALLGAGAIVAGAGGGDEIVKIQVRAYGEISIRTSVATGYVNLHGASYAGL